MVRPTRSTANSRKTASVATVSTVVTTVSTVTTTEVTKVSKTPGRVTKAKQKVKTSLKDRAAPASKAAAETSAKKSVADNEKLVYNHWLMKSEPESRFENGVDMKFSIDELIKEPKSTACWDGVRNYEARNILRDQMKANQQGFFYHSNCKQPGIVGVIKIVKEGYPDHTQFDKSDAHYDASSPLDNPKWYMVDVKFMRKTKRLITLQELKKLHLEHKESSPKGVLHNLALFTRSRLSVQPLTKQQFDFILKLENQDQENN